MSDTPGSRWPFSVSVVIPALNEGATIGAVIEVLVVDDCSKDDTASRAEAAGARVIRRPCTRASPPRRSRTTRGWRIA